MMAQQDQTVRITIHEAPSSRPAPTTDRVVDALNVLHAHLTAHDPNALAMLDTIYAEIVSERDRTAMLRDRDHTRYAEHLATLDQMLLEARQQRDEALAMYGNAEERGRESAHNRLISFMCITYDVSHEDAARFLKALTGDGPYDLPIGVTLDLEEMVNTVARYVMEDEMYQALAEGETDDE
jgi:hypothetical protein